MHVRPGLLLWWSACLFVLLRQKLESRGVLRGAQTFTTRVPCYLVGGVRFV